MSGDLVTFATSQDRPVMLAFTVASATACAVLIAAEWKSRPKLRAISKICASLSFLGLAAFALDWNATLELSDYEGLHAPPAGWDSFTSWIAIGLCFGMIGDVALLFRSKRAFLAGLGVFLFGHVAYVIGIARIVAPGDWIADAGVFAAAPVLIALVALALLWRHLGSMRFPVIGYVLAIVAMVIGAIAAARAPWLPVRNRELLVIGAALFFASDLSVARERFVARTFANKAWGLPCYFAGQLLIAWSLALTT